MFVNITSLLGRHLYLKHSQSVQYFDTNVLLQLASCQTSYPNNKQVQQANPFKRQILIFLFSTLSSKFV